MPAGFHTVRILCATAPELAGAPQLYLAALSEYGESVLIPEGLLFATATFRPPFDASANREAVRMNIRTCDYFVGILEETAEEIYRGFVTYAIDCAADEKLPMHRPIVFFREPGNGSAEFRESLAGRCEVHGYSSDEDLKLGILRMFAEWRDQVKASQAAEAARTR